MRDSSGIEIFSHGPEDTQAIGRLLGTHAIAGDVFLLVGGLGAGKTCLTQGILWGLGVNEYARSPTFVIVSEYQGRLKLYHMDLYRLDTPVEIDDLGLDEYLFGTGVCVVEWAEKATMLYPEQYLVIRMDYINEMKRLLTFTASGCRFDGLIQTVLSESTKD